MGSFLGPILYLIWSTPRQNAQSTNSFISVQVPNDFIHDRLTYPLSSINNEDSTIHLPDLNITVHSLSRIQINDLSLDYFNASDWDYSFPFSSDFPSNVKLNNNASNHLSNMTTITITNDSDRRRLAAKGAESTFVRSPVTMTWKEGKRFCESHYGSLASIVSKKLQKEANDACNGQCWIGLKAEQKGFKFHKWSDGRSISYKNWDKTPLNAKPKGSTCRRGTHFCSKEGGRCQCLGKVDYGKRHRWRQKWSFGSISCSSGTFGDPYPGTYKECCCRENVNMNQVNYKKVLAKRGACFDARNFASGYSFNAPQDGKVIGVELVHRHGGVRCSSRYSNYWGCRLKYRVRKRERYRQNYKVNVRKKKRVKYHHCYWHHYWKNEPYWKTEHYYRNEPYWKTEHYWKNEPYWRTEHYWKNEPYWKTEHYWKTIRRRLGALNATNNSTTWNETESVDHDDDWNSTFDIFNNDSGHSSFDRNKNTYSTNVDVYSTNRRPNTYSTNIDLGTLSTDNSRRRLWWWRKKKKRRRRRRRRRRKKRPKRRKRRRRTRRRRKRRPKKRKRRRRKRRTRWGSIRRHLKRALRRIRRVRRTRRVRRSRRVRRYRRVRKSRRVRRYRRVRKSRRVRRYRRVRRSRRVKRYRRVRRRRRVCQWKCCRDHWYTVVESRWRWAWRWKYEWKNNDMMMVQIIKENRGKGMFYPTDHTADITKRALFHRNHCRGRQCRFHWYKMNYPYHIYGKTLRFADTKRPKQVTTADRFSLQYGEGCCGRSTGDNGGRSCADVYFIYDQRGCALMDSQKGGVWRDGACPQKRIALCEKARRQIYKNYISVQALLPFEEADKYCQKYYGTHLATIHTELDNAEALGACTKIEVDKKAGESNQCWIGLKGPYTKWMDHSSALGVGKFSNWFDSQKGPGKGRYKLILRLKNVRNGYFRSHLRRSGLENERNPNANTYSILGQLNPDDYKLPTDQNYQFKLIYTDKHGKTVELIWRQSSWLDRQVVTGFESIQISHQRHSRCTMFMGLAASGSRCSYLDGNGRGHCWWNSVGTMCPFRGGIPAFDHQIATGQALYVYAPSTMKGAGSNKCAFMRSDGQWYEDHCHMRHHFVCDAMRFSERLPQVVQDGLSNKIFQDHEREWYKHKQWDDWKYYTKLDLELMKLRMLGPTANPHWRNWRIKTLAQQKALHHQWESMRHKLRHNGVFREYEKHGYFNPYYLDWRFPNNWHHRAINYGDYPAHWDNYLTWSGHRHPHASHSHRRMMDEQGIDGDHGKRCKWIGIMGESDVVCVSPQHVEVIRHSKGDVS